MAVLFRHPTAGAPTTTLTLNEVFVIVQPPNAVPYQSMVMAISGREYVIEESPNRQDIVNVRLRALHEDVANSFDGMLKLRDFHANTIQYSLQTFDLTDADGATYSVRYITGIESVREDGGGRAAAFERFSGTLTYRVTI